MARGAASKYSARSIDAQKRAAKAVELKADGWALKDIAIQCGYKGPSGAAMAIARTMAKTAALPAAALRKVLDAQLDEITLAQMPQVRDGDIKAADIMLKVVDRKMKLHGIEGGEHNDPIDTANAKKKNESYDDNQAAQIIKLLADTRALNGMVPDGMEGGGYFLDDGSTIGDDSDIPLSELDEDAEIEALTRSFRAGATMLDNGDVVIPPGQDWR